MSSPPSSKRGPSPARKPTLRQRMSSVVRRGSSFIPGSRSSSPAPRRDSDDPISSKPASVYSVEATPPIPLVMPQEKPEEREPEQAPVEAPTVSSQVPSEPAETVTTTSETTAEPPKADPVLDTVPVAEPATLEVRSGEEQEPPEESYAPAYIPYSSSEGHLVEHRDEPPSETRPGSRSEQEEEQRHPVEDVRILVSESPRSFSTSLLHEDHHSNPPSSGASTPGTVPEPGRHLQPLSLHTSRENLRTDLSPILEDERSALEEQKMPFAHPNGITSVAPAVMPTLSGTSDATTPRAMPVPAVVAEDKGKAKDVEEPGVNTTDAPHHDGYFSRSAPMTVPRAFEEHYSYDVEDPFRDPTPSTTHYDSMPEPDIRETYVSKAPEQHTSEDVVQPAAPSMPTPVVYPLPPLKDVTTGHLHSMPSDYTLGARSSRAPSVHNDVPTDETLPLLSGSKSAAIDGSSKQPDTSYRGAQGAGWVAHAFPDSTTYYSHPAMRVTTDINLERPKKLAAVMNYLEGKLSKEVALPIDDLEIWLHDEAKTRDEFVPVRCWVNHGARALGYWPPPTHGSEEIARAPSDDRLDLEYRYWAFMETHPAHVPLPPNAYTEAWDKLTWSYTERLLKSNRRAPPPFSQNESQELLTLLRSTSGSDSDLQAAIQTRVVARIHRRIVQWKQHFFRPEKPLPRGVTNSKHSQRNTPHKTFLDLVVAWLCLGIPYLYANRHVYRFDEEGGIVRSAGPMVVVGATVCIVAAIILLASVTFLALPGLDHISRTAGFISIIGSFASLGASLIAAYRNQVETQRMAARGGEGLVVTMATVTGGSILPSLPAVFLAWSVVSLITGIVLYAFRGSVVIDTTHWARFASFTRWTTIGVFGFCCGALIVSSFAIRR